MCFRGYVFLVTLVLSCGLHNLVGAEEAPRALIEQKNAKVSNVLESVLNFYRLSTGSESVFLEHEYDYPTGGTLFEANSKFENQFRELKDLVKYDCLQRGALSSDENVVKEVWHLVLLAMFGDAAKYGNLLSCSLIKNCFDLFSFEELQTLLLVFESKKMPNMCDSCTKFIHRNCNHPQFCIVTYSEVFARAGVCDACKQLVSEPSRCYRKAQGDFILSFTRILAGKQQEVKREEQLRTLCCIAQINNKLVEDQHSNNNSR